MGAADIVPGVSGGTVALVLGIYERLIENVHRCAVVVRRVLARDVRAATSELKRVEWLWLISLLGGILLAVAVLSSVLERLLEEQPVRMSGLFFGLILGSVIVAWRLVRKVDAAGVGIMLVSAIALFLVLGLRESTQAADDAAEIVTRSAWVFLLVGSIAICAMILPGISGSFLLVMMGMYTEVLGAVNDRDFVSLGAFAIGCAVGLALFSSALSWLLEHHHDRVIAVMIGLMLGSLRVLWPWPGGTATTELALPADDIVIPVLLAAVGFVVVVGVELVLGRRTRSEVATPVG
jgi:putative membrane protein